MPSAQKATRIVEFRNTTLDATVAVLRETRPHLVADELHKMLGGMPDFFSGDAAILDFSELPEMPERIDWAGLMSMFRRFQLQPVGIRNLPSELAQGARKIGLANLDGLTDNDAPMQAPPEPAPAPEPEPAPVETAPPPPPPAAPEATMIIDRPVRSGQQIYARGGDLVLMDGVGAGAEVIADGSIHCYGPLRGRALAGAQGNLSARIFTVNFGPELVSIGGVYRTFERGIAPNVAGKPACVRLVEAPNGQKLSFQPLPLD